MTSIIKPSATVTYASRKLKLFWAKLLVGAVDGRSRPQSVMRGTHPLRGPFACGWRDTSDGAELLNHG